VSQMLVFFMFVAHWVGSGWWALGVAPYNVSPSGNPTGTTWVVRANVCPSERNESSTAGYCLEMPDGETVEFWQKYMSSLYWSLTTLIKTPWVHPDTVGEKAVASIIVVFGAILFAAILGNITAMINSSDKSNAQLRDIMSTLHRLIGKYEVPTKLQKRVFMYVQTQWSTTKGLDNQRILAKVPPALRGDILEAIHADLIQTSPLFQGVSSECVRVILSKLRSEVCLAKETLIAGSQLCNEVYLLVRGVLQVQLDEGKPGGGGKGGARTFVEARVMVHHKKRSLASRKREKNMSSGTLDYALNKDPRNREAFKSSWETAVPRKLRLIMQLQQGPGTQQGGGKRRPQQRESGPPPPKRPRKAGASDAGRREEHAAAPARSQPGMARPQQQPPQPQPQPQPQQRKRLQQPAAPKATPSFKKCEKVRFGETNDRPPELLLIGKLGAKLAERKR